MHTFTDLLIQRLATASLQSMLFAAVAWALCRFLSSLTAGVKTWLWWLVAAQLLLGLVSPGAIELPLLAPPEPMDSAAIATAFDVTPAPIVLPPDMPAIDTTTPAHAFTWTTALAVAWAALVAMQSVIAVVRWHRLAAVVARAMPHDDSRLEALCAQRARALGLRRSPRLAVSDDVDSPQVVGLVRPTILLPLDDTFADEERDMALMHELSHLRRGDLWLGIVPALARALFFFHPLAWLATREYGLCREAACDALAVSRGQLAPRTYGRLLLRLGVTPHPHHALPGASPTFRILQRRLDMLGHALDARPRIATTLLATSLALACALPWRVVAADKPAATPATPAAPASPAPPAPPAPPATVKGNTSRVITTTATHDGVTTFQTISDHPEGITLTTQDSAWILRDPTYLKRIRDIWSHNGRDLQDYRPHLDRARDAELGKREQVISQQLRKLSERQAELMTRAFDRNHPNESAAYAEGTATLGREQAELSRQLADIMRERMGDDRTMAAWQKRSAEAADRVQKEVNAVLAEARRNHALVKTN